MFDFKEFGIKPQTKGFVGDKIEIYKVLNRPIKVHDFKVDKSKFEKGNGKCLHLQIEMDGNKRLVFTSSTNLIDMIEQVPKDKFPFNTTIIKENERFEFT